MLGDAVTATRADAWDEVYWLMATELVAREARLYQEKDWQAGQDWPQLEVVARDVASADTVAITLKPADGSPLPAFVPGQYLSVAIPVPEAGLTQVRQYSLSDAPCYDTWRITVKRVAAGDATPAGVVSNRLHDAIRVGDTLRAGPPAGDFQLRDGDHPVVLISAGVGITPMVSMLRHLALTRPTRPVVFAHATQDISRYAHQHEVETSLANLDEGRYHLWLEAPAAHDTHALPGRMDLGRIEALPADSDFYLCGPLPFMQTQRRWLLGAGIPRERIHYEVFGPDLFGELQ